MSEHPIKPRALTKEQIAELSPEDLAARLSEREIKDAVALTRATFKQEAPKRQPGEGTGEWRKRVGQNNAIDEVEFAKALQRTAQSLLYESQRTQRAMDALGAGITKETVKARKEAEAARKRRDHQADLESGRLSGMTPVGGAGWEGK